jgi:hypothetical protein
MGNSLFNDINKIVSRISAVSDTGSVKFDPTGSNARQRLSVPGRFVIQEGVVIQSRVGAYDCLCKIGSLQVACTMLSRNSNVAFGSMTCDLPEEGSRVLIFLRHVGDSIGWILGVINRGSYLAGIQDENIKTPALYEFWDIDAYWDNAAYNVPEDDKKALTIWASDNRPRDLLPGETAIKNENNCGYDITSYTMTVTAGASFIRLDKIDDEIRLRSTNFKKWTNYTSVNEFNDAGLISLEGREYSYQGEYLGAEGRKSPPYEKPSDVLDKEPRPRTRFWGGFLGNLWTKFVTRARKSKDTHDETLASMHVSQAGNIMVRSAGGISLERYDAIPVPKRLKEEWDPEGDKELDVTHEPIKSFTLTDPHAIGLLKSSKMAWEQKSMYQRFDELKKDFETQEETDIKPLTDSDQDPFSSSELKLSEYTGRKAGCFVGEDGSIIIRDAWGSEIVMVGGNICINTPGNIISTANRDIVSIAGNGAIIRGNKATDISADQGHTRIHGQKMVAIAGGTDDSPGGVLIEGIGSGAPVSKEEAGDSAFMGGVVIRSEKAPVSVGGKTTFITGESSVFITSGDDGETRTGTVAIDGGSVITTAKSFIGDIVEESLSAVTKSGAFLVSNTGSALVAGDSAIVINGTNIPAIWVSIDEPVKIDSIKDIWSTFQNSDLLSLYSWKELVDNAVFSFRTSSQARTDKGIEPWSPNSSFTLYEPYWQVLKDLGATTVVSQPTSLEVQPVHGSKCWPYKDSQDSGKFVKVTANSLNVTNSGALGVVSKSRETLKSSVSLNIQGLSEFKV